MLSSTHTPFLHHNEGPPDLITVSADVTEALKTDLRDLAKTNLPRLDKLLSKISSHSTINRGDTKALQDWHLSFNALIRQSSGSPLVLSWFTDTLEAISDKIEQTKKMEKTDLKAHIRVGREVCKTPVQIWHTEAAHNLGDVRSRVQIQITNNEQLSRDDKDLAHTALENHFQRLEQVLLDPLRGHVSRIKCFQILREVGIIKNLVKSGHSILDQDKCVTPLFKVDAVVKRMNSWSDPDFLDLPDFTQKSLTKFHAVSRRSVLARF